MIIVFDLDDTLYDEVEFVKSGFKEISNYINEPISYEFMLNSFKNEGSGRIFNKLIEEFNLDISLQKLIEIYRFHIPNINLPMQSIELLEYTRKFKTALISDGHYLMQQNKFNSLSLKEFIDYPIFTDFHHTSKPNKKAFQMVMDKFKNEKYVYISDNPKKDFHAPNELGWVTVRFKNKNGIYKDYESNATFEVLSRKDVLNQIKQITK